MPAPKKQLESTAKSSAKYYVAWLLAQLPYGGGLYFLAGQKNLGSSIGQTPTLLKENPFTFVLATIGWMVATGFLLKVWREVEQDAVRHFSEVLRVMPQGSVRLLTRHWRKIVLLGKGLLFTKRYRRRVFEDYGIFNDKGLGLINANRLDFERVYVELRIKSEPNLDRPTLDPLRNPVPGRQPVWMFLDSLRSGYALVLIGAPGSGKTTLLQHLLLMFSARRHHEHGMTRRLPIFVELRALRGVFDENPAPTLAGAIRYYWKSQSRIKDLMEREPNDWLESQLIDTGALLLLDGLDEAPSDFRPRLTQWLDSQLANEDFRKCLFVLTSRPGGYLDAPLERAQVVEVQPFLPEQSRSFIDGWYLANEIVASGQRDNDAVHRRAKEGAKDLRRRLDANPDLYALTVNPLLLTMVCMVHRYRGALPGSRSQLYGEICQVLLERWRQAKSINDDLKGEQKLAILRPLAERYMQRQLRELEETEVRALVEPLLDTIGLRDADRSMRFLRDIQAGSGLLLEREKGQWSFAHKTFQEFLTAEQWLKNTHGARDWKVLVSDEWWRETLILYAAKADASDICEAALTQGSAASWSLAYQCLSEAVSVRPLTRKKVEAQLRHALRVPTASIFNPAASALLHLRMREVLPLGESGFCRATLVTQAEYQRFLNESVGWKLRELLPPHWISERFEGDPESPILGLYPSQANEFIDWLNEMDSGEVWRLPYTNELALLPELPNPAWSQEGQLSYIHTNAVRSFEITSNFKPQSENDKLHMSSILGWVSAMGQHDLGRSLAKVSQVLDRTLRVSVTLNLATELAFALGLKRNASEARARARTLARAIGRNLVEITGRSSEIADDLNDTADILRWREALDSGPSKDSLLEYLVASSRVVSRLLDAAEVADDSLCKVWRSFLLEVFNVVEGYLAKDTLAAVENVRFALLFLHVRDGGWITAWEGVALVRDRLATIEDS